MYAAIAFALLSVACANPLASWSTAPAYGVNPIIAQSPVPALSYNAAGIHGYASPAIIAAPHQYAIKKYAPQQYAVQVQDGNVQRDFTIESVGEQYAIQTPGAQLQQSFIKSADQYDHQGIYRYSAAAQQQAAQQQAQAQADAQQEAIQQQQNAQQQAQQQAQAQAQAQQAQAQAQQAQAQAQLGLYGAQVIGHQRIQKYNPYGVKQQVVYGNY